MSSRLQKITECDVCQKAGATEYQITINGDSAEIDLCGEHDKWIEGLKNQILGAGHKFRGKARRALTAVPTPSTNGQGPRAASGMTVDERKASANAEPAEWRTCGICGKTAKNRISLNQHLRSFHDGVKIVDHDRRFARKFDCPECGVPFDSYGSWSAHADAEKHRPRPQAVAV